MVGEGVATEKFWCLNKNAGYSSVHIYSQFRNGRTGRIQKKTTKAFLDSCNQNDL